MSTDQTKDKATVKRYRERRNRPVFGGSATFVRVIELPATERAPDGAEPVADDEPLTDWKREEAN